MIEYALSGKSTRGNSKKRFFLYQNGSAFPPFSYVAPRSNHNHTVNINEERYACLVDGCSRLFETWGKTLNHMGTCGYNGIRPSKEESERFHVLCVIYLSSSLYLQDRAKRSNYTRIGASITLCSQVARIPQTQPSRCIQKSTSRHLQLSQSTSS